MKANLCGESEFFICSSLAPCLKMFFMFKPDFIFLDMGSTLTNEEPLEDYRIHETLGLLPGVTYEEFHQKMIYFAKRNQSSYQETCDYFHAAPLPWRAELLLETLQPGAVETLEVLSKHYPLGLIANQPAGTETRLEHYGIRKYFSVIISSAEAGVKKPDPAIYELGLKRAKVFPCFSVMVGDRLDNDIIPSLSVGLHAVWIRKGFGGMGNLDLLAKKPDQVIDDLRELIDLFVTPFEKE
jgi:HAD superfamily hydrolase (TIGR01549 family)